MIEWVAKQNASILWFIFIFLAFLMALVPYFKKIKKALKIKLSNQSAGIKDFSWRFAPDHFFFQWKDKAYYLQSDGKQFILEGGTILLSWEVKGAYRIDISGVGSDLKGNTAAVKASKDHCSYVLIAHTLKGKLTQTLELDPGLFRNLNTLNLSAEVHFNQTNSKLKTGKYSSLSWMHGKYKQGNMAPLPKIHTQRAEVGAKRYSFKQLLTQKTLLNPLKEEKNKINGYIGLQKIVKTYKFNPKKYHAALNAVKNQEKPNQ